MAEFTRGAGCTAQPRSSLGYPVADGYFEFDFGAALAMKLMASHGVSISGLSADALRGSGAEGKCMAVPRGSREDRLGFDSSS